MTKVQSQTYYSKDDFMPSTRISRNFGSIMKDIVERKRNKVVVLNNNELQAVILPIDEYEYLTDIAEIAEDMEIISLAEERLQTPRSEYVDFEVLQKERKIQDTHANI